MRLARSAGVALTATLVLSACSDARETDESSIGLGCGNCHGFPPERLSISGLAHPADTRCVGCHASTVTADNALVAGGTHFDGKIDTCTNCHELPPAHGLHRYAPHTNGGGCGVTCASCHPGYSIDPPRVNLATHIDGVTQATPITTNVTIEEWPSGVNMCTHCHLGFFPSTCTP